MFFVLLISMNVPKDEEGEYDGKALFTYILLLIVHGTEMMQLVTVRYIAPDARLFTEVSSVILILLDVFTHTFVSVNYVFATDIEPAWTL